MQIILNKREEAFEKLLRSIVKVLKDSRDNRNEEKLKRTAFWPVGRSLRTWSENSREIDTAGEGPT